MILVALGANLHRGDHSPLQTLQNAARDLGERDDIRVVNGSEIWHSPAYPDPSQPEFSNAVIQVETGLEPTELLEILHDTEIQYGRVRNMRNEARILDLDLLVYDDCVIDQNGFQIPHPRIAERAFVLYPMRDVSPDWIHPLSGQKIDFLIESLPKDTIIRSSGQKVFL